MLTGLADFDRLTDGFEGGKIYIIGGVSGVGKTGFITTTSLYQAREGRNVGFFTMEEKTDELFIRYISHLTHIPLSKIKMEFLTEREMSILEEAQREYSSLRIKAYNNFYAEDIFNKIQKENFNIIYIENMAYLRSSHYFSNRYDELRNILIELKDIALKRDIPVVITDTAKFENVVKRENKRPIASDLTNYNYVEALEDVVILIHRPEMFKVNPSPDMEGIAEIIIAKNRNRRTGLIKNAFIKELNRFENLYKGDVKSDLSNFEF